jgi:hypothetical protein
MSSAKIGPYYQSTLKWMREKIEKNLIYAQELQTRNPTSAQELQINLRSGLAKLREIEANNQARNCPFCDGQMFDLTVLDEVYTGAELHGYGEVPSRGRTWECQTCNAYVSWAPSEHEIDQYWTSEEFSIGRKQTFAAQIFDHFPDVVKVTYGYRKIVFPVWHLLIGDEWYRFEGKKKEVLERLGI